MINSGYHARQTPEGQRTLCAVFQQASQLASLYSVAWAATCIFDPVFDILSLDTYWERPSLTAIEPLPVLARLG